MTPILIAAHRAGAGLPVVLLHPAGFGAPICEPLVERLSRTVEVIVPDRRGYGESAGFASPASIDDASDDLARLLDHLGLDQVTVVGVSAGATLTLAFALRHPDRVVSGLAHEPLLGPLAPDLHEIVSTRITALLDDSSDDSSDDVEFEVAAFMSELVGTTSWNHLRPEWRDAVRHNAVATRHEVSLFPSFAIAVADIIRLSARGVISSIGEHSGPARRQVAGVLTGAGMSVRVIEGAGHLPLVQTVDTFADLVVGVTDVRVAS